MSHKKIVACLQAFGIDDATESSLRSYGETNPEDYASLISLASEPWQANGRTQIGRLFVYRPDQDGFVAVSSLPEVRFIPDYEKDDECIEAELRDSRDLALDMDTRFHKMIEKEIVRTMVCGGTEPMSRCVFHSTAVEKTYWLATPEGRSCLGPVIRTPRKIQPIEALDEKRKLLVELLTPTTKKRSCIDNNNNVDIGDKKIKKRKIDTTQ